MSDKSTPHTFETLLKEHAIIAISDIMRSENTENDRYALTITLPLLDIHIVQEVRQSLEEILAVTFVTVRERFGEKERYRLVGLKKPQLRTLRDMSQKNSKRNNLYPKDIVDLSSVCRLSQGWHWE